MIRLVAVMAGLCVITLMVLGAVAVSMQYEPPPGQEPPKVTDWMQAWGSIFGVFAGFAAALAATALFLFERRRAQVAEQQIANDRADAEMDTPRAVVVLRATFGGNTGRPAYVRDVAVGVHNYSAHPIRQVLAVVSLAEGREFILRPQTIIPPGDHSVLRQTYSQPIALSTDSVFKDRAPAVVYFLDQADRAWRKTSDNEISRTVYPYPPTTAL